MWGTRYALRLLRCSSAPRCKRQTRVISPSVCLLKSFMQASTFAPSPFSARASAIRSRTCGRQRLAFLAVSATGGARKPNPSEGGEGAPAPRTEFAKVQAAVKPAGAGCPHPSRRGAAPHRATFPKGKAKRSVSFGEHKGAEKRAPSPSVRAGELRFVPPNKKGKPHRACLS